MANDTCGGSATESAHGHSCPRQRNIDEAQEMVPLECVDDVIDFFDQKLQPSHPLRAFKLFPVAKRWRKSKFLVEEEKATEKLWVLDLDRKKRIKGKTCYSFKLIETQEELDGMLAADHQAWVQYMKDSGAWEEG